jgi:hypothetical protein
MIRACGSAALLATSVAGCDLDELLEVSDPSRLLAEDIETPAQADALVNGMEADFICAFGAFVVVTADLSDEYEDTNAGGDNWSLDRRRPTSQDAWGDNDCTAALPSAYVPVSRARWVADNLVGLLEGWTDQEVSNREERLARAYLLSGFSVYMLGAAHCTAALDEGPELTSLQLFGEAETRFTAALDIAQRLGLSDIESAARVGRARVRLYMGDDQSALTDAQAVPSGFVMNIFPSDATTRLWNRVWDSNVFDFSFGVPPWSRELTTGGVIDPRTTTFDTGRFTGWAPGNVFAQEKYTTADTPMPIARWEEAQLIIAEIEGGQTAVGVINALRAPHSLPQFASNDENEIQDMVVEERRRELWFEGFRAYDIQRLGLPLFPAPDAEYQPGVKGGSYGDQTCIPIPIIETFNNETIRGG